MSQKFIVRASITPGYTQFFRAGRGWNPNGTEIEVLDQDDDPMVPNPNPKLPDVPHPTKIGRKSLAVLRADPRISIQTADQASVEAMAQRFPELQGELELAKRSLEELTSVNEKAGDRISALEAENGALRSQLQQSMEEIVQLKAMLDEATKPRKGKVGNATDGDTKQPKA